MLLSFSIPTHHGRADTLARALDSVLEQVTPELRSSVQICVSDNASQDATQQVLAERRARHGSLLVYHRNLHDLGLVPNLLHSVAMADGEFCWLLGSDDVIVEGALEQVISLLREHPDVGGITLNRLRVDPRNPGWSQSDPPDELPEDPEQVHIYDSAGEIFRNVGLSHDYMSTQVINRRVWTEALEGINDEDLTYAQGLAHLYVMGKMVERHPRWIWYPGQLVRHTIGTSALDDELGNRYAEYLLVIMEGRSRVWSRLFAGNTPLYRQVMEKAHRRGARPTALIGIKLWGAQSVRQDVRLLVQLTRHFYWLPRFWRVTFPLLLVPHQGFKLLSRMKWAALGRVGHLRARRGSHPGP